MKVIIIEDEKPAARRLQNLILEIDSTIEIVKVIDSIEEAVKWFEETLPPELVFMDIQLADGLSFEILEKTSLNVPIIFTTAYDEYALKAFKSNGIDYLLKPIDKNELAASIKKFQNMYKTAPSSFQIDTQQLLKYLQNNDDQYKTRFLVKLGDRLIPIEYEDIAYFMAEEKLTFLVTFENKKYPVDYTLEQLERLLNPKYFFRLNRKFFTHFKAVTNVYQHFNGKLKIQLVPALPHEEIMVSKEKSSSFKQWLDN